MIEAFDVVELLVDLPDAPMGDEPLDAGDRGTVVDAFPNIEAYTVEFMRDGQTVAVRTVTAAQVRVVWRAKDHQEG